MVSTTMRLSDRTPLLKTSADVNETTTRRHRNARVLGLVLAACACVALALTMTAQSGASSRALTMTAQLGASLRALAPNEKRSDADAAREGMAPFPKKGTAQVNRTFRVLTSCVDDRVNALAPNRWFQNDVVDVRIVRHDFRTSGERNFFKFRKGVSMTPFVDPTLFGSGYEVTTDAVNWEFGFAMKNSAGIEWYEIGVGRRGLRRRLGHRLAPLAGLNIKSHDGKKGCAQKYGDYYNRIITLEEEGPVTYVFGSCAKSCQPPPPPAPQAEPAPAPAPQAESAPAPAPQVDPFTSGACVSIAASLQTSKNPGAFNDPTVAATETLNTFTFDHQGLYKATVTRTIGSSDVYFANTVSTDTSMWSQNYRRMTSMSYSNGKLYINSQNTPRDKNAQWSSSALANTRIDILKTSSLQASGIKLGAGIEYVGNGNGQSFRSISHDFGTDDYVVFAMVMNAGANNAQAPNAISDGFNAHIFDKTATGFSVEYGRHTKSQGWGNSDYVIHWMAFKQSFDTSPGAGNVVVASVIDVPNNAAHQSGAFDTLCVKHDLGTSNYKCFAQVIAKSEYADWAQQYNALFVVECEIAANYVYFSIAYTGGSTTSPINTGAVDYTQLAIEYALVRQ